MLLFRDKKSATLDISSELQMRAFKSWASEIKPTFSSMVACFYRAHRELGGADTSALPYPFDRPADILIQVLRKAGMIERKGRIWLITDRGRNLVEEISQ